MELYCVIPNLIPMGRTLEIVGVYEFGGLWWGAVFGVTLAMDFELDYEILLKLETRHPNMEAAYDAAIEEWGEDDPTIAALYEKIEAENNGE